MYPKCLEFVQAASTIRVKWVELLIPLIPLFAEALAKILEQCANDEDDAVEMLTAPTPLQALVMHRSLAKAMRRDGSVPSGQRNSLAWRVIHDGVEAATQRPELVTEAYYEATAIGKVKAAI